MPQPPYALLRASIAGGAPLTGGIVAAASATCQFSADPGGLAGAFMLRWEVLDYPTGWSLPAGWSVDSAGVYFFVGETPPVVTLPDGAHWGKVMPRLTLNNGISENPKVLPLEQLVDTDTAISIFSTTGLKDLGFNEEAQFSATKLWTKDHKDNLRILDAFIAGGGGGGGLIVTGTPQLRYVPMWNGSGAVWAPVDGIKILTFAPTVLLVETSQSVVHPAFAASYNVTPTAATLTNNANGESLSVIGTPTSFASAQTYQKTTPNQSVIWTLSASLGALTATPATCQMTWCAKSYWGVSSAPANTSAFITGLASSGLATTRSKSISVTAGAGEKIYICEPDRYGVPTFSVGGFAGGFITRATGISVTNAQGFTEGYSIYESVLAALGATTVTES